MPTTNYSGRKIDIDILGTTGVLSAKTPATLSFGLANKDGGKVITGIAKAMQKVLILLLTYQKFYDITWGNDLPLYVYKTNLQVATLKIGNLFSTFASDVIALLATQYTNDTPSDERIAALTLESLVVDANVGSILMTIRLTVESGITTKLVVPINKIP
jgi:hypothetical protein